MEGGLEDLVPGCSTSHLCRLCPRVQAVAVPGDSAACPPGQGAEPGTAPLAAPMGASPAPRWHRAAQGLSPAFLNPDLSPVHAGSLRALTDWSCDFNKQI